MKARKAYAARFVRDEGEPGWWVVTVPAVRGCRTQARTIEQGLYRIREALALFVDDADTAVIEPDVKLPSALRSTIRRARARRERAEELQADAAALSREAVDGLTRSGLSRRDAAAILGIFPQRVQQLLER